MKTRLTKKDKIPAFGSLASFSTSFSVEEKPSADEMLNAMDELARPTSCSVSNMESHKMGAMPQMADLKEQNEVFPPDHTGLRQDGGHQALHRQSRHVAAGTAKPPKACRRISRTRSVRPAGRVADGAAARQRTVGDELAVGAAQAPTTQAIRMANALMLERFLGTGQFKSPAALAARKNSESAGAW